MAVRPVGAIFRFVRDIEFNLFQRPRSRGQLLSRLGILGAVALAAFTPFLISSTSQDAREVAGAEFLAALTELDATKGELGLLRAAPERDSRAIESLEVRIAELEAETFLGYIKRDGDSASEGALVPDFRLLDTKGNPFQLSTQGKPAIVNFWASWCAFCIEEMPDLQLLHEAIGDRVTVIGINRGESQGTAVRFGLETGAEYTLLLDLKDELGASTGPYRVIGMPTTLYVDADGRVNTVRIGFQTLEDMQELAGRLLNEDLELTDEVIDTSLIGQITETLNSQVAAHAVAGELFARFEADSTLIEDIAWQRNVTAQAQIWTINAERFADLTPPSRAQALYDEIADSFELILVAGTLLETGVALNDGDQIAQGMNLFAQSIPAFTDAVEDLQGLLSTL
jgi:thiol-disulfide isomerase/thioredoxin